MIAAQRVNPTPKLEVLRAASAWAAHRAAAGWRAAPRWLRAGAVAMFALWVAMAVFLPQCANGLRPRGVKPIVRTLQVTGYCRCGTCCSWRRTWYGRPRVTQGPDRGRTKRIGFTRTGERAWYGTVAADPKRYPFGTVVYVKGYGYGRVEDTGSDVRGDHIDVFFYTHEEAVKWGSRTMAVRIWPPATTPRRRP